MRGEVKATVCKILKEDERARKDDNYLILKVIEKLEPDLVNEKFKCVMLNLKDKKMTMENITRARRKFFEKNPHLNPKNVDKARRILEKDYIKEYANKE